MHALPLALAHLAPSLSWPASPLPIEVRPAHRRVERQGPEQRGAPPRQPPRGAKPSAKGPGRARPAAPGPPSPAPLPPPPQTADLKPFAPGDARIVVLLRADRLRASP